MLQFVCPEPRGDIDPCYPMLPSDCLDPESSSSSSDEEQVFYDLSPEKPEPLIEVEQAASIPLKSINPSGSEPEENDFAPEIPISPIKAQTAAGEPMFQIESRDSEPEENDYAPELTIESIKANEAAAVPLEKIDSGEEEPPETFKSSSSESAKSIELDFEIEAPKKQVVQAAAPPATPPQEESSHGTSVQKGLRTTIKTEFEGYVPPFQAHSVLLFPYNMDRFIDKVFVDFDPVEIFDNHKQADLKETRLDTYYGELLFTTVLIASPDYEFPDITPFYNTLFIFAETAEDFEIFKPILPDIAFIKQRFIVTENTSLWQSAQDIDAKIVPSIFDDYVMEEINLSEPKIHELDQLFGDSETIEDNDIVSYMSKKSIPYEKGTLKSGEKMRKTVLLQPIENEKLYKSLAQAGLPVKSAGSKFVRQYHSEVVYVGEESDEELLMLNMSINMSKNVAQLKQNHTKDTKLQEAVATRDFIVVKIGLEEDEFDASEFIDKWQSLLGKNEKLREFWEAMSDAQFDYKLDNQCLLIYIAVDVQGMLEKAGFSQASRLINFFGSMLPKFGVKLDMKFGETLAEYAEHAEGTLWEWLKENCISGEAHLDFNQSIFDGLELIERLVETAEIRDMFDQLKDSLDSQLTSLSFADTWMNWLFSKLNLEEDSITAINKVLKNIWGKFSSPEIEIGGIVGNLIGKLTVDDEHFLFGSDDNFIELMESLGTYAPSPDDYAKDKFTLGKDSEGASSNDDPEKGKDMPSFSSPGEDQSIDITN